MKNDSISNLKPLGFQWETSNPFLFCAHHLDQFPAGNDAMGPVGSLRGRNIGQDFTIKDGWRMYHGQTVPGFPAHPHRGFEPVVQYGPFVMNTESEIRQALNDYRATEFGGWPWNRTDPVHPRDAGRFARYADGRVEKR